MMVPAFPEAGAPARIRHNRSANNAFVDEVARDLENVGTYVEAQLAAGRPIVRLTELSKLDGGLSHLLGVLLDTYMFNPEGVNMSLSGVALAMASGVVILRATSVIFIGDEPALADMCLAKGLAGIKSCMRCANLVLCRYFVEARGAPHNIRSTEVDFSKFEPLTVARLRMTLLRLKDMHPVLNKTQFGHLSTRFGFSHSDFNLAMKPYAQWCRVCCPTSLVMHAGASPQRRADRSAGSIQMNLRKIFHPNNLGATGCFGLGARGCFGLGPACVTSLCACLDVVELLVTMKNATVPPALLRDAVTRHVTSRSGVWHRHRREFHEAAHDPTLGWHMLEYVGALYSRWVRSTLGLARTPRVTSAVSCRTLQSNSAKP